EISAGPGIHLRAQWGHRRLLAYCYRRTVMRTLACMLVFVVALAATAADLESRVLTHYVPQDLLEKAVRTEGWTEVPLDVKGGVRKGDTVRIWTGGSIDRGNGDYPGQNVASPCGPQAPATEVDVQKLALSPDPAQA